MGRLAADWRDGGFGSGVLGDGHRERFNMFEEKDRAKAKKEIEKKGLRAVAGEQQ